MGDVFVPDFGCRPRWHIKYKSLPHKVRVMKTITLLFFLGLFYLPIAAQTSQLIYDYDDGGNRIQRRMMVFRLADTTATEDFEEPPLEDGDILAYPNPTRGEVTIGISPNLLEEATAHYMLVDLSGREVRKGPIVQSQTGLNLTGEANGNYILSVIVGERREEWQIIKQ